MRKILEFLSCPSQLIQKLTQHSFEDIKAAIRKQDLQKISQLINEGAPTHQKNESILHYATLQAKQLAVQSIVQNHTQLINQKNEDGDTALMLALFSNNEKSQNNEKQKLQKTQKIIKLLLPISNQNIRDNNGNTAFIIAAANGNNAMLMQMLGSQYNSTMTRNFQGQTALHRAAYHGQLSTIKLLLQKTSLRLSQTDRNNNNALHMACTNCQLLCINYMLKKMKEPEKLKDAKNKQEKTPADLLEDIVKKINTYKRIQKNIIDIQQVMKCCGLKS